jgi:hypothetical protein
MVILGVTSVILLPVGLELGVEVTRNADASSAILWFSYVSLPFADPSTGSADDSIVATYSELFLF